MKLVLQRRPSAHGCTIGELSIDGVFECYTLEDVVRERPGVPVAQWKVQNGTAIPAKIFKIIIDLSNRFKRMMIHIIGVDGFEGIRMHAGNTAVDTDGCILVGQAVAADGSSILHSQAALAVLQPKIQAALDRGEEVTIDVRNAVESTT